MRTNPAPVTFSAASRQHYFLIRSLVARELRERYVETRLGWLWMVLQQVATVLLFTFVFGVVFQARWGGQSDDAGLGAFAVVLLLGLAIYTFFAETVSRSARLVLDNKNLVKQIRFPLWVLAVATSLSQVILLCVSLAVVLVAAFALDVGVHATAWTLPLILLPMAIVIVGLAWALSAASVYLRDILLVLPPVLQAMLFLSPVFYPVTAVAEPFRKLLYLNPITPFIEFSRNAAFLGRAPEAEQLLMLWIIALAAAGLCWLIFRRLSAGLADLL